MVRASKTITTSKPLPLWAIHGCMILATVIVSSSFTVGKGIAHGLDPGVLVLLRYIIASLCFLPIVINKHGFSIPPPRKLAGYSSISFCNVSFFWCMFESLKYTSALNTSIIFTLVPGISGLYSAIFLGERLGVNRLCALAFGMVGALWVIFEGNFNRFMELDVNYGDLIFLVGCFLMAGYTPLVKKVHRKESFAVMTLWLLLTGTGWLALLSANKLSTVEWSSVESHVWLGIVYLATFSTIITFYLSNMSTIYLGPTRVMAYSFFYPAGVLLIDWGMGKGLPPLIILPGVLVVTMATLVLQKGTIRINHN